MAGRLENGTTLINMVEALVNGPLLFHASAFAWATTFSTVKPNFSMHKGHGAEGSESVD